MDSKVTNCRKRQSGIQGPMLKKVLKTMPHLKENIPEQPLNNTNVCTNGLKNILGMYYVKFEYNLIRFSNIYNYFIISNL